TFPTNSPHITAPNKGEIMPSDTDLAITVAEGCRPPRHASICLQAWRTK
ncbi:unnamed protein product, partial [Musa textilis]